MCGICGIIGRDSKDESAAILARMLHSIVHRGPDEEGTLLAPRFAAGTRRLSIIDLAGGTQPIWNESRTPCQASRSPHRLALRLKRALANVNGTQSYVAGSQNRMPRLARHQARVPV